MRLGFEAAEQGTLPWTFGYLSTEFRRMSSILGITSSETRRMWKSVTIRSVVIGSIFCQVDRNPDTDSYDHPDSPSELLPGRAIHLVRFLFHTA